MGNYIANSAKETEEMLKAIGKPSVESLFEDIPQDMLAGKLNLPEGLSEMEVARRMRELAAKNIVFKTVLRGAGSYRHYIPAAVKAITSKEEFVTAYTPYQAEISQGVLQSIYEYQSMICALTGMDAANASVYDGATAAAEATVMCRDRKRNKVLVSASVHPQNASVIATYAHGCGMELRTIPEKDGLTDLEALSGMLDDSVACVYLESPNFFGLIEDMTAAAEVAHAAKAKLAVGCNPISMALLKTPAECGADIAVGEGQPLGMPMAFGGPYLGFMACRADMMRKLPGRIVGETTDVDGKRAFVLTLQAREQHIRREKASSNICSNEALCAMTAAVYMATMGPEGMKEVAQQCMAKAHYLAEVLAGIGFTRIHSGEFFHEFATVSPMNTKELLDKLAERGILGGYAVDEKTLLWCATEVCTKEELDATVTALKEILA